MNHNWNVYKVFSSGKRAKSPYYSFVYEDENNVEKYFLENIKSKFKEKFLKATYKLVRADRVQSRICDVEDRKAEELQLVRERQVKHVLSKHLVEKGIKDDDRLVGALMMAPETKWKWQWVACQAATNKFVIGLSPRFLYEGDALQWLEKQISQKT